MTDTAVSALVITVLPRSGGVPRVDGWRGLQQLPHEMGGAMRNTWMMTLCVVDYALAIGNHLITFLLSAAIFTADGLMSSRPRKGKR